MHSSCVHCNTVEHFRFPLCRQFLFPWGMKNARQAPCPGLSLKVVQSLVLGHRWLQMPMVVVQDRRAEQGQATLPVSKLIPHLFNHVFIGLDGIFRINDFVELPREWPITACCKNEMGVVKLLRGQKMEEDVKTS